ncbi:MAG: phosphatase PAP2 family protein [Anaerolineae bacterium]
MTDLLDLELNVILWLREMLPGLVGVFEMLTFLGNEMFFLLFMPLVYWCFDRATGARLTVLFLLSAATNAGAKALLNQPRPFEYAPDRVRGLFEMPLAEAVERYEATGNGFPSGHTQNTVTIWGYLAAQARRVRIPGFPAASALVLVLAALLMLLVPLSRIYLAVHFPRDVVGGYVMGAALLAVFLWLEPVATAVLVGLGLRWQVGIAVAIPALGMLLYPHEATVTAGATMMGMGVGFALDRRWLHFETAGPVWQRALRYALGIAGMLVLYAGLKAVFASLTPVLFWRFFRYTVMGLWGSLGAPWVFTKAGLTTHGE